MDPGHPARGERAQAPPAARPVGVFDSGVGGLSVLAEIRRQLPAESIVYVADSGFAPYGTRSHDYVESRSSAIADFLTECGVKAIVVACNTATAVIAATLRARLSLPVVAIEPPVKPAAATSRSGVIGVLATQGTLASERFDELVAAHAGDCRVVREACPDLVELVERGIVAGPEADAAVGRHVGVLVAAGADRLALGCTHFHFLRDAIERAAGPGVGVIDPAAAVARELGRRLAAQDLLAEGRGGAPRVFVSRLNECSAAIVRRLCPEAERVEALAEAYCSAPGTAGPG